MSKHRLNAAEAIVSKYPCKHGGNGKGNAKRSIQDNVGKAFCSGEILGYIF